LIRGRQLGPIRVHIEFAYGDETHRERTGPVLLKTAQNETPAPRKLALDAHRRLKRLRSHRANLSEGSVNLRKKCFFHLSSEGQGSRSASGRGSGWLPIVHRHVVNAHALQ
jgi:hypothetical protein